MRVVVVIFVIIIVSLFGCSDKETRQTVSSIGEKGILQSGASITPVAVTKEAFDQWSKARVAKDEYGMVALLSSGLVFTPSSRTQVLVIDKDTYITKVRILQGEYTGQSGWVAYEYVRPEF